MCWSLPCTLPSTPDAPAPTYHFAGAPGAILRQGEHALGRGEYQFLHRTFPASRALVTTLEGTNAAEDATHILVLDDNIEILDLLGQILTDECYAVTLSTTPLDAETIHRLRPDVIITDAVFRGAPVGLDTIQRLREDMRTSSIPVICCTLFSDVARDLAEEGYRTLQKPFELDEVLDAVSHAMVAQGRP